MRLLPLAATASCLALTLPVHAAPFDAIFGPGKACYARSYDRAHLMAHPRQTVSTIEVDFTPANADGVKNIAAKFELGFGFQIRGKTGWYTQTARHAAGAAFACSLEADGGEFSLTPQAGSLKLDVINRGGTQAKADQIDTEGADDVAGFGKPGGDDLSFLLNKAPHKTCDASTADTGGY